MSAKFCNNCGGALTPGAVFCDMCGTPVPGAPQAPRQQSYTPPPPAFEPPALRPPVYQPPSPPAYQPSPQPTFSPPAPQQPAYQPPVYQPPAAPVYQFQPAAPGNLSPKSKTVLALLNFFLGWAGAHKFYAGKSGQGVLIIMWFIIGYSVAFMGGPVFLNLPLGIWILVDFIMALQGKVKDKEGRLIAK